MPVSALRRCGAVAWVPGCSSAPAVIAAGLGACLRQGASWRPCEIVGHRILSEVPERRSFMEASGTMKQDETSSFGLYLTLLNPLGTAKLNSLRTFHASMLGNCLKQLRRYLVKNGFHHGNSQVSLSKTVTHHTSITLGGNRACLPRPAGTTFEIQLNNLQ